MIQAEEQEDDIPCVFQLVGKTVSKQLADNKPFQTKAPCLTVVKEGELYLISDIWLYIPYKMGMRLASYQCTSLLSKLPKLNRH